MARHVTFRNGSIDIASHLHLPEGFDEDRAYPAVVIATPGSSVKEQVGAVYGSRLAEAGFVALAFDPSHQGESGGEPRDLEDPAKRVEDIRCALDFLMTPPFVDEDRVGLLGICAGGGYAVNAALTERRFRAVATVAASNIGAAFRRMGATSALEAASRQRTVEAQGGSPRRERWLPDSLADAAAAGISDPDVLAAVWFYRESEFRHERSTNRYDVRSVQGILAFDAFALVPELLTQPLLVIVGGRRGITHSYEDGESLFARAGTRKDFVVVDGAGHYDLYHVPHHVARAVAHLTAFFDAHLGPPPRRGEPTAAAA